MLKLTIRRGSLMKIDSYVVLAIYESGEIFKYFANHNEKMR